LGIAVCNNSFLAISISSHAQPPQKMSYQAVIRNAGGNLVQNHVVSLQISILKGSTTGTAVYNELQNPVTNSNGLVSVEFGGGAGFSDINWADGPYFIKTDIDPEGGVSFSISGISQILSVPYALHAKTAENGFSGNYNDLTNKPLLFDGTYSSLTGKPSFSIVSLTGKYDDLIDKPNLFSGSYNDLSNKPTLFSGSYYDLTNKPTLFSGSYNDLTNKPSLFDGAFSSLSSKPTTLAGYGITDAFNGTWASLTGKPSFATISTTGSYNDLINKPTLFSGSYNDLTNKPALFDGVFSSLSGKPTTLAGYGITDAFNGTWTSLTGKPSFATVATSGSYNDLLNLPTLNINNWNTAYGWGNHVGLYRPIAWVPTWTEILENPFSISSPVSNQILKYNGTNWVNWDPNYLTAETQNLSAVLTSGTDGGNKAIKNVSSIVIGKNYIENTAVFEVSSTTKGFLPPRLSVVQINDIYHPAEGLTVYNTDSKTLNVYNGTAWVDMAGNKAIPKMGEAWNGGIVFYLDSTECHGLICSTMDVSTGIQWYNGSWVVTGATDWSIGKGSLNTIKIVNIQGEGTYAAKICDISPCFLPSLDELMLMYTNLKMHNIGNFSNGIYWCSTEINYQRAYCIDFSDGYNGWDWKNSLLYVRAVKAF